MSHTQLRLEYPHGPEEARRRAEEVLSACGYAIHDYSAASVWKKPAPLSSALQFIKLEFSADHLDLSSWVQAGVTRDDPGWEVTPGIFTAAMLKRSLDQIVQRIRHSLSQ